MDPSKRFADYVKELLADHDYDEIALAARIHRTNLYAWARGTEIPADIARVRSLARALRADEETEAEMISRWEFSRRARKAAAVIGQMTDMAQHEPEALTYDPDLENADWMALLDQADPRDRENIVRAVKAFLSEVRRRH